MNQEKENSGIQISDLSGLASLSKEAREFLASIFGPLLTPAQTEFGELIADVIQVQRAKNFLKVLEKLDKKARQHNLKLKPPDSLKILVPIMENSSIEDNEEMQNRWSNLLLTEITKGDVHPVIPEILKQIGQTEAKILELMFKSFQEIKKTEVIWEKPELERILNEGFTCKEIKEKIEFQDYLIDNLIHLNLCKPAKFYTGENRAAQEILKRAKVPRRRNNIAKNPEILDEQLKIFQKALEQASYVPNGEYERITLTKLGFECVKAWSDPPSDTSSQTASS